MAQAGLFVHVAVAVGPAAALLWWVTRLARRNGYHAHEALRAALYGAFVVALAVIGGLAVAPHAARAQGIWQTVIRAFLIAGLVEETAKLIVVLPYCARRTAQMSPRGAILLAVATGLGFGVVENTVSIGIGVGLLAMRSATTIPLHAATAGIIGYSVGIYLRARTDHTPHGREDTRPRYGAWIPLVGLAAATTVHGLYDFLLLTGGWTAALMLVVVGAAVATVILLYARSPDPTA